MLDSGSGIILCARQCRIPSANPAYSPHDSRGARGASAGSQARQAVAARLAGWGLGCGCCRDSHHRDVGILASRWRPPEVTLEECAGRRSAGTPATLGTSGATWHPPGVRSKISQVTTPYCVRGHDLHTRHLEALRRDLTQFKASWLTAEYYERKLDL